LSSESIIPDVSRERLSAARHRTCPYAENGCVFGGNRRSVAAHEQQCDFVPRSVLRRKMEEMGAIIAAKDRDIEKKHREGARAVELVVALELEPVLKKQKALMKSALGPDSAKSALRVLYDLTPTHAIAKVKKYDGREERTPLPALFTWENNAVEFRVEEKNHNLSLVFSRVSFGSNFEQGAQVRVSLMHPYNVMKAKGVMCDLTKLNSREKMISPNFMTSTELRKYCVGGYYFFESKGAIADAGPTQSTCHCIRHFFRQ